MAARWGNSGQKVAADEARSHGSLRRRSRERQAIDGARKRDNLLRKMTMSAIRFPIGGTVRGTCRDTIGKRREILASISGPAKAAKRFFIFIRHNALKRPDSEKLKKANEAILLPFIFTSFLLFRPLEPNRRAISSRIISAAHRRVRYRAEIIDVRARREHWSRPAGAEPAQP
jgi:hypothetical protein